MSPSLIQRGLLRSRCLELAERRVYARSGVLSRRSYATEDKAERESFKGQLYQSTNERVEREREQQARYAQIRELQKRARGTPAWLVPFGRSVRMSK